MTIQEITSAPPKDQKSVLFFWSSWHEATAPQGSTSKLFETLASTISPQQLSFYRVEAEVQSYLSATYGVTVVPSFVLLHGERIVDKIEGVDDVARLTQAVGALKNLSDPNDGDSLQHRQDNQVIESSQEELLNKRLKHLTQSSQVMLFMKGSPDAPRCGFSRQAVELLNEANVAYSTFDILSDEAVRQGLKKYSDWPTYPQLYVNGELVGGLDIMKEMKEDGEDLAEQLNVPKIGEKGAAASVGGGGVLGKTTLEDRLTKLVNRSKVMLFMKGLPSQPRCGFSRQICEILEQQGIAFDAFDILSDEEVRQGLKTFSDWPTYPQLYVNGDLVGGLDIVKEMVDSNELKDLLSG